MRRQSVWTGKAGNRPDAGLQEMPEGQCHLARFPGSQAFWCLLWCLSRYTLAFRLPQPLISFTGLTLYDPPTDCYQLTPCRDYDSWLRARTCRNGTWLNAQRREGGRRGRGGVNLKQDEADNKGAVNSICVTFLQLFPGALNPCPLCGSNC